MNEVINRLSDHDAMHIFQTVAKNELDIGESETVVMPELQEALSKEFDIAGAEHNISDGELARQALQVLAMDSRLEENITTMAEQPPLKDYSAETLILSSAAFMTAMIVVLKTGIEFERDKDGKMSFKLKVEPSKGDDIKQFIKAFAKWSFSRD